MPLPAGLIALANRDFRVYYAGNLVAQVGSWMQSVSQSWLVLQLTNSPFLLGLTATLQSGPILLLAVFTGALADRLTKRNILIVTQAVQGTLALALGLLVWSGHVRFGYIAVMAVIWGITSAFDQPTRQSFIMELVGRSHVVSAVGMNSASFNTARIVGPAVAGVLIARVGLFAGFMLNTLAFAVSIAALTRVPARGPTPRASTTILDETLEGLTYAVRTPAVRFVLSLQVVVSFCVFNFSVYVPLLARNVLGLGSEGFGLLMASLGVGAVAAGLSLGALGTRRPAPNVIAAAAATACAGLVGLAVTRQCRAGRRSAGRRGVRGNPGHGRMQHVPSAHRARCHAGAHDEPLHVAVERRVPDRRFRRRHALDSPGACPPPSRSTGSSVSPRWA